ncbi:MAG: hypothetical protein HYW92_03590 [Nitrosarchaeum sp.]|nr:hypothetical protein [Nitrosarchaeum sp.]
MHSLEKITPKISYINKRKIVPTTDAYFNMRISGDSARDLARMMKLNYDFGRKTSGNFGYVNEDCIAIPIKKIEREHYEGDVFNLAVLKDESYTTFTGIVHNCISKQMLTYPLKVETK